MSLRPHLAAPVPWLLTALLLTSLSGPTFAETPEEAATIGRQLEEDPRASTFIRLLKNTDKAEALLFNPGGSTTVFVPTDAAFENMDPAARERLFDPSNKHYLERVLTYHAVHNSRADGFVVRNVGFLQNGLGQYLTVGRTGDEAVSIDGARVEAFDLACSNGVVHFIDRVLDPVEYDLFERLERDGRFTVLTRLIKRSGLTKTFQNRHRVYTVFAPTDAAFESLPPETIQALLSPEKLDLLSDIIRSHISASASTVAKVEGVKPLGTPESDPTNEYGQTLVYRVGPSGPTIDGRRILEADLVARNGFLHVIDAPLQPKRGSVLERLEEAGFYTNFLDLTRKAGVYDLLGQFNSQVTVFAPTDAAFSGIEGAALLARLQDPKNAELLRGVLQRHIVNESILTTNSIAYRRFNSTLGARLDVVRDGDVRTVQGVPIVQPDLQARNGVAHGIAGVLPAGMEPVDDDQRWSTYRRFVLETLDRGSELYGAGEFEEATDYYARRNYEFRARYGTTLYNLYGVKVADKLTDDRNRNYTYDFALTAWRQRNGFRGLLRSIEGERPLLIDEYDLIRAGRSQSDPSLPRIQQTGAVMTERFQGWRVALLTADPKLAQATRVKWDQPGPPFPHGGLKVRLWQTKIP
ncbi:MAG: fasciclin domain-containing protein [Planctomycetota bacterium]